MKFHLHIDEVYKEPEVHIYAAAYTEAIEQLMKQQKAPSQAALIGYLNEDIHVLKVEDIYAVVTEDGKIYLHTERDEYESKYKLYEIEETYPETFARINKSTLINLDDL